MWKLILVQFPFLPRWNIQDTYLHSFINVFSARTTVNAILDTLSNNDFVTVLSYTNVTYDVVPCFKDMLIQATPENVYTFKNAIANVKTEGLANLTEAFTRAFNLLSTYRETRGCGADTSCNQLIMLVTDGVPGNLTEVNQYLIKNYVIYLSC